jgi:electron transfer flavoprotein alpha subunit
MNILIYIDTENGTIKKSALEVASYAKALAEQQKGEVIAVTINAENPEILGTYGVDKVLNVTDERLQSFSAKAVAHLLAQAATEQQATTIVFSASAEAKNIAPLLAISLQAGYVPNVISLPESADNFIVKTNVFSGKAFALQQLNSTNKVLSIAPNSFSTTEKATTANVIPFAPTLPDTDFDLQVISREKVSGKVSLDDANIIVSGGRGLKGAEHWDIVEQLADVLGAAIACSKPVADMGWRPHSEHVGQTGKVVAPNLYIAIGISGAIQHLAGVNASKVKLVINTDPEAPFFKAADYGVVGDAFEIIPKLINKLKN